MKRCAVRALCLLAFVSVQPVMSFSATADFTAQPAEAGPVAGQPAQPAEQELLRQPAQPAEPEPALQSLLNELEITFEGYLNIFSDFEEAGTIPHYLEKYAPRYSKYLSDNPDVPESTAYANVNVSSDIASYTQIKDVPDLDAVYLLVNNHYQLPQDWSPGDLVEVQYRRNLREEAADNFILMRDAAAELGLRLYIVSAHRPYSNQASIYRNAVSRYGAEQADREVARPGHSEHQTGLAADILHRSHAGRLEDAHFQETAEFEWMLENAHLYGFILRYPEQHAIAGNYLYEPWHWRYVGADIAAAMRDTGISLFDEFYGKYLAPDVLVRVRDLVVEQREAAEAAELARIEQEQRERREAEEAVLAAQEAERLALEEAAEAERLQKAEIERLAAALAAPQNNEPAPAMREPVNPYLISGIILATALTGVIVETYGISKKKTARNMLKKTNTAYIFNKQ